MSATRYTLTLFLAWRPSPPACDVKVRGRVTARVRVRLRVRVTVRPRVARPGRHHAPPATLG